MTTLLRTSLQTLSWEFSKTSKNNIHSCFFWREFIDQLLLKVISLQQKNKGRLIFWRNKESKYLLDRLQPKNMNNKHFQVFLVLRKNPRKWNYRSYCRYFWKNLLMFWWKFLMALTSTKQLFKESPLYRRFLHNDHLPYFQ